MGRLLPFQSDQTATPGEPRVLDLDDDATDEALSALSSETARKILQSVYEEPKTPPELRDEVGTSLQNVHYHVENLEDAELIQPAGSGYSEKGTEMTVYAPASEAFVLFAGQDHQRSRLTAALKRLLGAIGLLAVGSVAFRRMLDALAGGVIPQMGAGDSAPPASERGDVGSDGASGASGGGDSGGDGVEIARESPDDGGAVDSPSPAPEATEAPQATATPEPATTPTQTPQATSSPESFDTPTATPEPAPTEAPQTTPTASVRETLSPDLNAETPVRAADAASQSPLEDPAVTFFLGGAFMLLVVVAWLYYRG